MIFLQNDNLFIRAYCIPLTSCSFRIGLAIGWATPSRNCEILEGNQPSLYKLDNSIRQLVGLQNYANLLVKLHYENCTILPSRAAQTINCAIVDNSHLLCPKTMQISLAMSPNPSQKCAFSPSNWAGSCMCKWVDWFPLGPRKTNLHAWATPPKETWKGIPWFRDLFLADGGYMQGSSQKPLTKCCFF